MIEENEKPISNGRKADGTFVAGNNANPAGRPKGSRHKISLLAEKLMSDDVEGVVKSVVSAAKNGDMTAARLILERVSPPRKDTPISIELPDINSIDDVSTAMALVVKSAANAEIGLSEADALTKLLQGYADALHAKELEARISALEQAQTGGRR